MWEKPVTQHGEAHGTRRWDKLDRGREIMATTRKRAIALPPRRAPVDFSYNRCPASDLAPHQLDELYRLVVRIKHMYIAAGEKWQPALKRQEMLQPGLEYLIARHGRAFAGFVSFTSSHEVFVWELHVAAKYKRQGLGRKLLAMVASGSSGSRPVCLRTFECNKSAVSLYRSAGFRVQSASAGVLIMIRDAACAV